MNYYLPIVCAVLVFALFRIFFLVVLVNGESMLPTLDENDKVLALRYWPARWLKKGQIVVIFIPSENGLFIKRVAALSGESFRALVRTGRIEDRFIEEEKTWEIPPEYFFVCGDNPDGSYDSRYLGPLQYSSLYALVIFRMSRSSSSEIHV